MKILRAFSCCLFILGAMNAHGQFVLSGTLTSSQDSSFVRDCVIVLDNGAVTAISDAEGKFRFTNVSKGEHTVHVTSPDFKYASLPVVIAEGNRDVRLVLHPRTELLEEVMISDVSNGFGFTRLRAVDNMGIYEGKKTEVIVPSQLVANLSTNNARQIFARVAGLNIWENDGAGLQLSIGARGLDPNRTSNFNVRQNGYDISADALGYPESYYTPPIEAVEKIEIVRGAASLQYGTQFGGLINFVMKKPVTDRKLQFLVRQTAGSFGFYNAFASASGTTGKVGYYVSGQYKRGDGFRQNSHFNHYNVYANTVYKLAAKTDIGFDFTSMGYLAQQPGGLNREMFNEDPRQSNRERNWFQVNWNLAALHLNHQVSSSAEFNLRLFGLMANRYSVGFRPNRVRSEDDNSRRDLIRGEFQNWGVEARYLHRYNFAGISAAGLAGVRYYHGFNHSNQGEGSTGKGADFAFENEENITYDYRFPNRNTSVFIENVFFINDQFSITPGLRFEYISTTARGYYGNIIRDLADNVIARTRTDEDRTNSRRFVIAGLGLSYKPAPTLEVYSNVSQNYRSITFNDMRIASPSFVIDPKMKDEDGYSFDLGVRSEQTTLYSFDVSGFYLRYNNRIGEVLTYDEFNRTIRKRGNIGEAAIAGIESYGEIDLVGTLIGETAWKGVIFGNVALLTSEYVKSENEQVIGKQVEFVPAMNVKAGIRTGYKNLKTSIQYTYVADQFTDATNAKEADVSEVTGLIPAYDVIDFSVSYDFKQFRMEGSVNNVMNNMYFTRRATGYPGPGILPSDGRGFYLTLQAKF